MEQHKFKIGQTVHLVPNRLERQVPPGAYTIQRLLPVEGHELLYRVKHSADGHERVVNEAQLRPSEACGGTLVVPGSPGDSYLYQKLTNPAPCSGSQMPRTDLLPAPLPACVTALVSAWIAEGAAGPATDGGGE